MSLCDIGWGKDFLNKYQKNKNSKKEKMIKLISSRFKIVALWKTQLRTQEGKSQTERKVFAEYTYVSQIAHFQSM